MLRLISGLEGKSAVDMRPFSPLHPRIFPNHRLVQIESLPFVPTGERQAVVAFCQRLEAYLIPGGGEEVSNGVECCAWQNDLRRQNDYVPLEPGTRKIPVEGELTRPSRRCLYPLAIVRQLVVGEGKAHRSYVVGPRALANCEENGPALVDRIMIHRHIPSPSCIVRNRSSPAASRSSKKLFRMRMREVVFVGHPSPFPMMKMPSPL
jgi:hypothetical protein